MHRSILKIMIALNFLLFFASSLSVAQDIFQGKVTFEYISDEGQNLKISYFGKGNKFLMQSADSEGAEKVSLIYDGDKRTMITIMNEQKMYVEMPFYQRDEISDNESVETSYFVKTGNSQDILGYSCDEFEFNNKDKKGLAFMTKELGSFVFMGHTNAGGSSQWQKEIISEGYFLMLVREENSSGELETIFKVIDLELINLEDKMFSAPPGFKKFDPNIPKVK